jgi:hypothetical protein
MYGLAKVMLVKKLLEWDFMIFPGALPPLASKVLRTTFHSIQIEDEKWVNPLYSMGRNL